VAAAFGAAAEVEIEEGYPIMLNDPDTTAFLGRALRAEWGEEPVKDLPPIMASEDFAYYLEQVPGTYFRLGCGNVERGITHSMHTSRFDIDEDVLPFGVAVFSHLIREYLRRARGTDA
jgi:metal-dependent amidase/aminoacylase/carboxypeptidase family protein